MSPIPAISGARFDRFVRCVVACEAPKTASMAAEVETIVQEHRFLYLKAPVQRVCGFDTVMPYYKLELDYLPDATKIGEAIQQCAAY